jgi:hypothetical protein
LIETVGGSIELIHFALCEGDVREEKEEYKGEPEAAPDPWRYDVVACHEVELLRKIRFV